jgi:hypothetical protein
MARNRLTSEDWDANFHQPNGTFGVAGASWAPDIQLDGVAFVRRDCRAE